MSQIAPLTHAAEQRGPGQRALLACVGLALRASLLVSPRPGAWLVRRIFAAGGAQTAEALARHAPQGVEALVDERYGDEPDMLLDVFRPSSVRAPLPAVVWVHGGGFVGGAKEELSDYFRLVASNGYAVVAPRYSLAPRYRHPTPPRQVMQALAFLQANSDRLLIDPARIAIGGDSAGAHIAAQLGAIVTTPGYADVLGVVPTIAPDQLRGLVLACGPYGFSASRHPSAAGARFAQIVLWSYSGTRRFLYDPGFAAFSVTEHVTAAFPPSLVTVGNADALRPHSELLVERLRERGAETETLFFADDHDPPLGHEYQFDLDGEDGQLFLRRLLEFLERRLATAPSA